MLQLFEVWKSELWHQLLSCEHFIDKGFCGGVTQILNSLLGLFEKVLVLLILCGSLLTSYFKAELSESALTVLIWRFLALDALLISYLCGDIFCNGHENLFDARVLVHLCQSLLHVHWVCIPSRLHCFNLWFISDKLRIIINVPHHSTIPSFCWGLLPKLARLCHMFIHFHVFMCF